MTEDEAKQLLRKIARQQTVRFTNHCRERMKFRNVVVDDMLQVLMWPTALDLEYDMEAENWKSKVTGRDIEGDELTVVVAVLEKDFALLCITVTG